MTIAQTIADKVEGLPPEQQQKALEFVESLSEEAQRRTAPELRRPAIGKLKGLIPALTLEDFQAARREMWQNFPRDVQP